ncbi:STAS domain-containing protein [Bosea sp. (in: a-proteobacteria)]|uniref:STAS domain-containing protein n=1 Tax=Bosea sp. (in: a-proteobacteria) TaxID=1871050 RepID=UPI003B3B67FD
MTESITVTKGKTEPLALPADCTVRTVAGLADHANGRLAAGEGLVVDGSAVATADITFVQLMVSAARSFEEAAQPFAVTALSPAALSAFERSGIAAPRLSGAH